MPRGFRLFVGNIPFNTTRSDLEQFFDGFKLLDVKIVTDRETNRPRGFCFVEVESALEQQSAIEKFNGQEMGGRAVVVNEAKERERRDDRRSGHRGGRREMRD